MYVFKLGIWNPVQIVIEENDELVGVLCEYRKPEGSEYVYGVG